MKAVLLVGIAYRFGALPENVKTGALMGPNRGYTLL
jgi:hypothetical protein